MAGDWQRTNWLAIGMIVVAVAVLVLFVALVSWGNSIGYHPPTYPSIE